MDGQQQQQQGYPNPAGIRAEVMALNAAGIAASNKALIHQPPPKPVAAPKFKKAPDAPKRFKSAFIIFSAEKHKEIKEAFAKQGRSEKTTDIAKLVSEAWREMPADEKEIWEKKARKDKARYEVEKAMYKGPWKIPANRRTPKDPTAPKRPMSAFLAFSNKRRAGLKRENPDATNADLSKMLSKTWKEAPQELRKKYMDEEAALRAVYKVEMAKWRKRVAEEKKQEREEREAMAMQAAEARQNEINANGGTMPSQQGLELGGAGLTASQMYGNPYAMASTTGAPMAMAMQGAPPGADPSQYANMMGNPFAPMNAQQQLISSLFTQQLKGNPMVAQGNIMYQGFGMPQGGFPAQLAGQPGMQQPGMMPAGMPPGMPGMEAPPEEGGAKHEDLGGQPPAPST